MDEAVVWLTIFILSVFVGIDVGFTSESRRLSFRSDHMF